MRLGIPEIRLYSGLQGAPFVFVSGLVTKEMLMQGSRLGVSDFLEKPFDRETFVEITHRMLEIGSRRRSALELLQTAITRGLSEAEKQKLKVHEEFESYLKNRNFSSR